MKFSCIINSHSRYSVRSGLSFGLVWGPITNLSLFKHLGHFWCYTCYRKYLYLCNYFCKIRVFKALILLLLCIIHLSSYLANWSNCFVALVFFFTFTTLSCPNSSLSNLILPRHLPPEHSHAPTHVYRFFQDFNKITREIPVIM